MKNIFLITEYENDNLNLRNKLEKIAFNYYGNLCGLRVDENKKIIYLFNFRDKNQAEKFKMEKLIQNFKITEE